MAGAPARSTCSIGVRAQACGNTVMFGTTNQTSCSVRLANPLNVTWYCLPIRADEGVVIVRPFGRAHATPATPRLAAETAMTQAATDAATRRRLTLDALVESGDDARPAHTSSQ